MRYGLTAMVLSAAEFVPITKSEYEKIGLAKRLLIETLYIEQKFDLIVGDLLDFETDILALAAKNMLTGLTESRSLFIEKNSISRRVVNLLSACRLYTDHVKHHLSEISRLAELNEDVGRYFRDEYDRSFAYRFMEALRNHVQHRGFPFHSLIYSSGWSSLDDNGKLIFSIGLSIDSTVLKEDGKFKASVLAELEALEEEIDLQEMIRRYIESLGNIHVRIRQLLAKKIEEHEMIILKAIDAFAQTPEGKDSIIGLAAVIEGEDEIVLEEIPLHREFIDLRKFYERRNRSLVNLSKRVASNEVREKKQKRRQHHTVR
ncbi:hypothetical protein [Ferrovibrio sp.]|uniref:hypothetical protein n=1 Tax=Ferrovibrio sp. TaxID=1917215 RepID=UPI0035B10564